MVEGYVDATGVQDVFWEANRRSQVIVDAKAGKTPPPRLDDPGFVITQANMRELADRMWGAVMARASR